MDYATQLARRAVNQSPRVLRGVLCDACSADSMKRAAGLSVVFELFPELSRLIHEVVKQTEIRVSPLPPLPAELRYQAVANQAEFFRNADRIMAILWELRQVAPNLRADDPAPVEPEKPVPATPQKIHIDLAVTMPSEMRIASLPDRVTSSTITRDDAGNITATTQTERDAA